MEQPLRFVAQEVYIQLYLRQSLYDLKQIPHGWFGKFSQVVEEFGMQKSKLTTSSSTRTPIHVLFYWYSMWMILLSLGMTLKVSYILSPFFTANSIQKT